MKLTAKVIAAHSASEFTDNQSRITLKVVEADSMDNKIKLPNDAVYGLDQALTLLVLTEYEAANFYHWLGGFRSHAVNETAARIIDQLRPDPPPPWEVSIALAQAAETDDNAETQEFRLGGTV